MEKKNLKELSFADDDEKETIYAKIQEKKAVHNEKVSQLLTNEHVLYLVLKHFEKQSGENWHLYAPVLESELFAKLLKNSKKRMCKVVEDDSGEISLYSFKFAKKL